MHFIVFDRFLPFQLTCIEHHFGLGTMASIDRLNAFLGDQVNQENCMLVKNVDSRGTGMELENHFRSMGVGGIKSIIIVKSRDPSVQQRMAVVEFDTKEAADSATDLHGSTFRGSLITIKRSLTDLYAGVFPESLPPRGADRRNAKGSIAILVRNLQGRISREDLIKHFSKFYDVEDCCVPEPKVYAFVYFTQANRVNIRRLLAVQHFVKKRQLIISVI